MIGFRWFSALFISLHLYNESTVLSKGSDSHLLMDRTRHTFETSAGKRQRSAEFRETDRSDDQMLGVYKMYITKPEKPEGFGRDWRITILVEDLQVTSSTDILHFFLHLYIVSSIFDVALVCSCLFRSDRLLSLHQTSSRALQGLPNLRLRQLWHTASTSSLILITHQEPNLITFINYSWFLVIFLRFF